MDDLVSLIEPDQRPDIVGATQDLCLNSTERNGSFIDYYRPFLPLSLFPLIPPHPTGSWCHFSIIFTFPARSSFLFPPLTSPSSPSLYLFYILLVLLRQTDGRPVTNRQLISSNICQSRARAHTHTHAHSKTHSFTANNRTCHTHIHTCSLKNTLILS